MYPVVFALSLLLSLLSVRLLKGRMLSFGISGIDVNKEGKPRVPEAGGMLLLPVIWIMFLLLINLGLINPLGYVFLFTITCFAAIGFFDDGFKLFKRERGWGRYVVNRGLVLFLLTLPFSYIVLPPLLDVCSCTLYWYAVFAGLLILFASSMANSFAGINGWEVGSSAILIGGLTVMVTFSQVYTLTLITLCLVMLGAALGLFWFNRYPARVFPGDSGTLLLGSFIGCMVIFVDKWYLALGLFAPHILDIALKYRTNPNDMSQKREKPYVLKNGKLEIPASKKLDFAKFLIKKLGPMGEKQAVRKIHLVVLQNTLFWTLLYILLKII